MMSGTVLTKPRRKSRVDYEALLSQMLVEMGHLEEQMDKSRARSEQLCAETQIIKAETEVIKAKTTSTISELIQQVNSLTKAG